MEVHTQTKMCEGVPSRPFCQKNWGTIHIKQDNWQNYWQDSHLKGHLFKMGLINKPARERCHSKEDTASHVLCDCETLAELRFWLLGSHFMKPSDYHKTQLTSYISVITWILYWHIQDAAVKTH
jgi:hypothetical protein